VKLLSLQVLVTPLSNRAHYRCESHSRILVGDLVPPDVRLPDMITTAAPAADRAM